MMMSWDRESYTDDGPDRQAGAGHKGGLRDNRRLLPLLWPPTGGGKGRGR